MKLNQMVKCLDCKSGDIYLKRDGDVHIVKCERCDGNGVHEYREPEKPKEPRKSQSRIPVDLDALDLDAQG